MQNSSQDSIFFFATAECGELSLKLRKEQIWSPVLRSGFSQFFFFLWKSWQPVNGGGLFCSSRIPGVPGAAAELWLHFTLLFLSDDLLCFPQFLLFPKMFCASVRFLICDTVLICGFILCGEALMRNYCNL